LGWDGEHHTTLDGDSITIISGISGALFVVDSSSIWSTGRL
jgi:hypothetical protein